MSERFIDTNIILNLLSGNEADADRAEIELSEGCMVSVQVLNEFAAVALRKLKMSIVEIREFLSTIRDVCQVVPIDEATHDRGLVIVERYRTSVYDAMIIASALQAGCRVLVSEDFQHGQTVDGVLKVRNPFR